MNDKLIKDFLNREKINMVSGNSFWSFGGVERFDIPSVKTSDASCGIRQQYKDEGYNSRLGNMPSLCYPSLCACGCSFDEELIFKMGKSLGEECLERGIAVLLGPGINIKRNPLCGRNFEYISEDPVLSGKLGAAFIKGMQSIGVAACPKHFAANNQETRRAKSDSVIDDNTLFELYLRSFEIAVKEGKPWAIMGAYNRLNGIYCCENSWLLNDILREQWGFDGTVISDWGGVNDIVSSLNAGLDVQMPGGVNGDEKYLEDALNKGVLKEEALDRACEDILLLEKRTAAVNKKGQTFSREEHIETARKAAEGSFVLLKNESILPIERKKKIFVIGQLAKRPRYQGAGSSKVKMSYAETPWHLLKNYYDDITFFNGYDIDKGADRKYLDEAVEAAKNADAVLIFAGLPEKYESEGFDRDNMKLPVYQNALINEITKENKNTAVILQAGAPVEMPWRNKVKAILMCYLGGSCLGSALLNILNGTVSPSGRLAESFPERLIDVPSFEYYPARGALAVYKEGIDVGYRFYNKYNIKTAYPFGHGLSYTSFMYGDLSSKFEDGRFVIKCTVENTGSMDGYETVQIYSSYEDRDLERKLAGFTKVFVKASEKAQAEIIIEPEYISEFDGSSSSMRLKKGIYTFSVGENSAKMILSSKVVLEEDLVYEIKAKLNNKEDFENYKYLDTEKVELTDNSSLRELQRYKVVRPVAGIVRAVAGRIDNGLVFSERMPEMIMDTPLRQLPMGLNGAVKSIQIKKACSFLNKIINRKSREKR